MGKRLVLGLTLWGRQLEFSWFLSPLGCVMNGFAGFEQGAMEVGEVVRDVPRGCYSTRRLDKLFGSDGLP